MRDGLYAIVAAITAAVYGLARIDPPAVPVSAPVPPPVSTAEVIIRDDPPASVQFGWVPPSPSDIPQVAQAQGPCPGGICPLPERPATAAPAAPATVQAAPRLVYRSSGGYSAGSCAPARRGLFGRILGR